MKKTLAAVAVLGAFAGSALAADVTLYGVVDTGFMYSHTDLDRADKGYDATDSFSMESGMGSGSRVGFKGTEDLGNGLTVGFVLENGFTSDDGAEKGVFFDRESALFVQGGFGKVAFGRIGSINQGTSSWGKVGMINAFGTSWKNSSLSAFFATDTVRDNMIAYQSPNFAGFTVYAQYGMGANDNENESTSDRYYALGVTYGNGPVNAILSVDSINYQSYDADATKHGLDVDDSLTVTFGGNYDFEVAKIYAGVQYFDEVDAKFLDGNYFDDTASTTNAGVLKDKKMKGYALTLSADAPLAGGKAMFGVGYYDAEAADSVAKANDFDLTRWVVSAGYDYNLSKRTDVYAVANYMQDKYEAKAAGSKEVKPDSYALMVGLRHKF